MKKTLLQELKKDLLLLGLATTAFSYTNVKAAKASETEDTKTMVVRNYSDEDLETLPELISYYSNVFSIKEETIFDMYEYETSCYNDMSKTNVELEVLNVVRDLYYNYMSEDIKTNTVYQPTKSPEELIEKYSDIFGINKNIALAICYNECGTDVNSANFRKNHNPAGIGPHMHFENDEVGIIYYIAMLKYNYNCGLNTDSSFFGKVGKVYCPGTSGEWASHCSSFYNNIVNDYYYYNPELKEYKAEKVKKQDTYKK